jgi:hypothetical protein
LDRTLIEEQFKWDNIQQEIQITQKFLDEFCSDKIAILIQFSDYQTRLTGMYLQQIQLKQHLGLVYKKNELLDNILLTQPYWSYSIILLIRNTMFGSARVLLRQFFESLLVAKYSEYDPSLVRKWISKKEGRDSQNELSIGRDVFQPLIHKNKPINALRKTWSELSDFTHPTRWSQQIPRVPRDIRDKTEIVKWITESNIIGNTQYTLDLFFMILCMNNHLLTSHWGRKAYRWYFGYSEDPYRTFEIEKSFKQKIKGLINAYFDINKKKYPSVNKVIKPKIFEYRRNWA